MAELPGKGRGEERVRQSVIRRARLWTLTFVAEPAFPASFA